MTSEERQQRESLLNFMAFNHKERQHRTFLPNDAFPPPPPPRPPAWQAEAEGPEALKANATAQTVLRSLLSPKADLKCSEVPKLLLQRFTGAHVKVHEATFSLMVQACVVASDLRGASDFLMRMESAGHCADSELLDKVMDLYAAEGRGGSAEVAPEAGAGGARDARGRGAAGDIDDRD